MPVSLIRKPFTKIMLENCGARGAPNPSGEELLIKMLLVSLVEVLKLMVQWIG